MERGTGVNQSHRVTHLGFQGAFAVTLGALAPVATVVGASGDGAFFIFLGKRACTRLAFAIYGERVLMSVALGSRATRGSIAAATCRMLCGFDTWHVRFTSVEEFIDLA